MDVGEDEEDDEKVCTCVSFVCSNLNVSICIF